MRINILIQIISLILFPSWFIHLYYKIFDKKIRIYVIGINILLIFCLILRCIKDFMSKDINIIWYSYYISLIFMPTLYYMCSKYLLKKENIINKIIIYGISIVLVLLVLTNDIHKIVFSNFTEKGSYTHNIGYYIIAFWMLYLIFAATINLVIKRREFKKDMKFLIVFTPIILGIVYTVIYILNLFDIRRTTDMPVIIGLLFFIGIESILKLDLIPNNVEYSKIFKNSYLNIGIVSKDGELLHISQSEIKIPDEILLDIKNKNVKKEYVNIKGKNQVYVVQNIKNGYSVLQKDYSNIEKMKNELKNVNAELKKQEEILENQKKIKDKLYELKINKEIMDRLEQKINSKREKINEIIDSIEESDIKKVEEVKFLIAYCKRMSNLIISNYNNENYNKESLLIILNELLQDAKSFNVNGVINIKNNLIMNSNDVSNIYEIIFVILENIRDTSILVNISEEIIRILISTPQLGISKKLHEEFNNDNWEITETSVENETTLIIKSSSIE